MTSEVLASQARGNTKARAFSITLNDIQRLDELREYLMSLKSLDYLIIGHIEEAPSTKHQHIHIYAHFKNVFKPSIKKCCGAHIEIARGSADDNLKYCSKDGEPLMIWGEKPHQGLKTVKQLKEIDIEEVPPQYYNIKNKIDREEQDKNNFFDMLEEIKNDELKEPNIIYITGGTGKGKTYKAYKIALENYDKNDIGKLTLKNDFFDVINEKAKCYVIEEFRPSQIKASDFLQLTDKYGYRANIKGGFVSLRPEMIIICSIIPPQEIYKEEINKQFMRRIKEIIDLDIDPEALN